ncbi:putative exonuclease SbcC [Erwinia phage vB_EamM_Yoloswag]|uniref:Putative exonuclease SbcC n=1 Tax=Erwinia phage vB_EamM_Yoloswag TaxID=1958956 RepID=A0A1S6L3B6_9CAUD|nr:putative exonuclease SbcC [Erwinia phage vB_EamM_Yoloswag]AQT28673.1 putative exonuclease SbcC [Erwinia phage vB_EamM_Yoloswag]
MQHGIRLKSIRLKRVGTYEELELTGLDTEGFATISGENLDSPDVRNNKNGVGKSLMFGAIPTLLFEADPLALAKKAKTNMLGHKESEIELTWGTPQGKDLTVIQTAKKYKIFLDGDDQKVDRQDVARDWIGRNFPLNSDEFYSYCYIQTQIPHPFQRAKPAERLQYLTSLFNLDVYDQIRASLKKRLDAARDAETESKGLADMLDVTQRKQNQTKITDEDRKRLKKIIRKCDQLKEQRNELYEAFVNLSTVRNNAKQYEQTLRQIRELGVASKDAKAELKHLRKQLNLFDAYAEYAEELDEYKQQRTELEQAVKKIGLKKTVDTKKLIKQHTALVKQSEELESDLEKLDEQEQAYDAYCGRVQELGDDLAKLKSPSRTLEEAQEERAEARAIIKAYHRLHEHLDDGTTCPTCSQDVDLKSMAKAARRAEKTIGECDDAIAYHTFRSELDDLKQNKVKRPKLRRKDLEKKLKSVEDEIEEVVRQHGKAKRFDKLTTQLESLRRPKKVEKPKGKQRDIENQIEQLETLQELQQTLKAFNRPEKSFKEIDKQYTVADQEIKTLTSDIAERERKAQALQSRIQEHDHYEETLTEIRQKLKRLQPMIDRREVLEVLYKAYSNNALKLRAVEGRLKQIEDKLNEYSPLVFPEPMRFTLSTNKQGVVASITRVASKQTTDISIMSGAEQNCFRLLYAIAIMPFIPQNRRTNFIVLDEPESHCSESVIHHLVENFLPVLKQIVPNIFWITPLDDEFSDNRWKITKREGRSTLEKVAA